MGKGTSLSGVDCAFGKEFRATSKLLYDNPGLNKALIEVNRLSQKTGAGISSFEAFRKVMDDHHRLFDGNEKLFASFQEAFKKQNNLLALTKDFYPTEAIHQFRNHLTENRYGEAVRAAQAVLFAPVIEAPDLALFKLDKKLFESAKADMPRGLATTIADLHLETAKKLAASEEISYDSERARFFAEAAPEAACNARETNVVFSTVRLFGALAEEELMDFLCFLSRTESLGLHHHVGKKLLELTQKIADPIDFDEDYYYHARAIGENACPYTNEDMTRAPHGYTGYGRYNHVGQNYLYFSNARAGAIAEIRIHEPGSRVQVARLKPKNEVRLVDLSSHQENKFLEYCRFPFDPKSKKKVPREYLIPAFFSDCCRLQGFDGIKYNGRREYNSYVTWTDGHFELVEHSFDP